jgi:hypothetical protein
MNKKAKLYLLIIINLIAWGYVGYRIYGALQGDDELLLDNSTTTLKKIDESKKEDTIVLSLNYADPFLKGGNFIKEHKQNTANSKNSTSNTNVVKSSIKTSSVASTPAQDIKYIGMVKNNDKGTQTAMISINGKSYFAKKNDMIEGFTFINITNDFIKLKKGKESLIINK